MAEGGQRGSSARLFAKNFMHHENSLTRSSMTCEDTVACMKKKTVADLCHSKQMAAGLVLIFTIVNGRLF